MLTFFIILEIEKILESDIISQTYKRELDYTRAYQVFLKNSLEFTLEKNMII